MGQTDTPPYGLRDAREPLPPLVQVLRVAAVELEQLVRERYLWPDVPRSFWSRFALDMQSVADLNVWCSRLEAQAERGGGPPPGGTD